VIAHWDLCHSSLPSPFSPNKSPAFLHPVPIYPILPSPPLSPPINPPLFSTQSLFIPPFHPGINSPLPAPRNICYNKSSPGNSPSVNSWNYMHCACIYYEQCTLCDPSLHRGVLARFAKDFRFRRPFTDIFATRFLA
jgi:hypothetical protein